MRMRGWMFRRVCAVGSAYYLIAGAALFFAPAFFYAHIAPIGSYNEHYARDLGSFLLPLGGALAVAATQSSGTRLLLAFAAVASGLHAVSHLSEGIGSWNALNALIFFVLIALLLGLAALAPPRAR